MEENSVMINNAIAGAHANFNGLVTEFIESQYGDLTDVQKTNLFSALITNLLSYKNIVNEMHRLSDNSKFSEYI